MTTCPVTNTVTSGGSEITQVTSTLSTVTLTSTSTFCTECEGTGVPVPTGQYPVKTPVPGPADCPGVVPQCLNTWLSKAPDCNSNSDISCFCPSSDFTSSVIDCIQAWGGSDAEIQYSLSYFAGICAAHVPENPGIITYIPTTITLVPTQPPIGYPTGVSSGSVTPSPSSSPASVPCTTLTVSQVVTGDDSQTSLYETTVTVPQVGITTGTGVQPTYGFSTPGSPQPTSTPTPTPTSTPPTSSDTYSSYSVPPIRRSAKFATKPASETTQAPVRFTGAASPSLSMSSGSWFGAAFAIMFGLLW